MINITRNFPIRKGLWPNIWYWIYINESKTHTLYKYFQSERVCDPTSDTVTVVSHTHKQFLQSEGVCDPLSDTGNNSKSQTYHDQWALSLNTPSQKGVCDPPSDIGNTLFNQMLFNQMTHIFFQIFIVRNGLRPNNWY